jgi:hypothetical protein
MPTTLEYFDSWFVKVLESLYPTRDAGFKGACAPVTGAQTLIRFVIMITIFPLLERYLRQRAGIPAENDKLNDKFFDELSIIPPELRDHKGDNKARDFWQMYRNGLLHQGTFFQKLKVYYGLASHDITTTIVVDENNGNFCVHPEFFAKRILRQIAYDFSTYEGASSAAPPLPTVGPYQFAPDTTMIIGTTATGQASGDWRGSPSKPSGRLSTQLC